MRPSSARRSQRRRWEVKEDVVLTKQPEEGTNDLISEFRDLPSRLHETLMPDLARLSQYSKAFLSAANAGIANSVRLILSGRLHGISGGAAGAAALHAHRAGAAHGPVPAAPPVLLLAQTYLAIYFATLALTAAATGLEPLRFVHAASPAAYA
ncbi:hypothetical protein ZEAMMB73_Zm00001d020135 [Zea mays]|jgi:hypothetical protein|uniref:Uncharacterized protein n=1 Tax=Zea mays TaxID=4577 RepID=A0A1D6I2A2_MAIZE|nr:hypothetical protein ZEAMMB73_Zm00001d020135 [Zea mays]